MNLNLPVQGAGLGLRRSFMDSPAISDPLRQPDFFEIAPENWMGMGGRYAEQLQDFTRKHPFVCHGLSLSIGDSRPLDMNFLGSLRRFLEQHCIACYSEHLSYSGYEGHLYDLLPVPFTQEAVVHVAGRVQKVQDFLGRRIALENVSYYAAPGAEMTELEFLLQVLDKADCDLLLDVNNVFVNAVNHCYDPEAFILALPGRRIAYLHVAGHLVESEDLRVDTHGDDVIDEVWNLLALTYRQFGCLPTLLERDFNIPPVEQLLAEVDHIRQLQSVAGQDRWLLHG
ncbi:MAG: DUF692 domain-containing protein [Fluviicoccus sp.]|uniref:HvfB family MNIO-type RiPP peptide maturase n=1 Tax=Fluviicoccus sp. TaxID=2003552 RepID=UPI002727ABC9|nr:DUF692 domain-containing protein [Fluviicoccus sp.]MDO8330453.1 DUF692 domain-containing protein [Fluviicoccus sp.]